VHETDDVRSEVEWSTSGLAPGSHKLHCTIVEEDEKGTTVLEGAVSIEILPALQVSATTSTSTSTKPPGGPSQPAIANGSGGGGSGTEVRVTEMPSISVAMRRSSSVATDDVVLWMLVRASTENIGWEKYNQYIDPLLCPSPTGTQGERTATGYADARAPSGLRLPFPGVDAYRLLKVATEAFLKTFCGVNMDPKKVLQDINLAEESARVELPGKTLEAMLRDYLVRVPVAEGSRETAPALPYLALIREKMPEIPLVKLAEFFPSVSEPDLSRVVECSGIIAEKLSRPCYLELIWCYWQEEGMLVQTMNRIAQRFMNIRTEHGDPLANLEIDPLRSLGSLLWGYVQDEQHRLSVVRRAHEYDHQYGLRLEGRAVTQLRTVDRRSKFLESFHNLLHECVVFYRRDDDTTVVADAFPVLNAVKDAHHVLAQGAHNQFGDLPSAARQEMLIQQWLLSRPEVREFLGGRVMVPYTEPWMDRVDAMKSLQGWSDVSVAQFADLAHFGEQLLLSIRYGGWSKVADPAHAATWARYWRAEIQGYVHAYRAATGVDLTLDALSTSQLAERTTMPSVFLLKRLRAQRTP